MIRIEQLTRNFSRNEQNFSAVDQVTFSLKKGEFVALIGHSGSGKTTIFNMIGGLILPTSGTITINGQDLSKLSETEKSAFRNTHIGYVLQGNSLLNNFSVLDNICMPVYLGKSSQGYRAKALALLKDVGLEELADEYPCNLSGGEKRRVAIIRAMINDPELILADEPTSNLDPENAHKVMQMLKKISKNGTTVLLTTHELEYLTHIDKVFQMEKGKLFQSALHTPTS